MRLLPGSFAGCLHVSSAGLNNCDDPIIWQFAKRNGFTIVTFDADFFDMAALHGSPPKIVRLRTGNLSTPELAERIILNASNIVAFINDTKQNCLKIY
jgi:predicted nuclease of predicted toxin-antitoxin system